MDVVVGVAVAGRVARLAMIGADGQVFDAVEIGNAVTTLSNVSEVTGEPEAVNITTTQLRDGSLLFMIGVAPQEEARTYLNTFGRVRQSLQIADQ